MGIARYHDGQRQLQDQFDSRRIADRLEQVTYAVELDEDDRDFIEAADMFFLATADAEGRPECSYKGGDPGFVVALSPREIACPGWKDSPDFRDALPERDRT